jgi:hypothetical protein
MVCAMRRQMVGVPAPERLCRRVLEVEPVARVSPENFHQIRGHIFDRRREQLEQVLPESDDVVVDVRAFFAFLRHLALEVDVA